MNKPTGKNMTRVLQTCLKIENLACDIYTFFEKAYSGDPSLSTLWNKTAHDETLHANHFSLALNLGDRVLEDVTVDLSTALNLFSDLESYFHQVKRNLPSVTAALETAIIFESSLAELHIRTAAVFKSESFTQLFSSMAEADHSHVTAMQEALDALKQKH